MMYSPLEEEKKLWRKGYKRVACLDEAGRGSLAGPVVAAVVMIKNSKFEYRNLKQYLDSKFPNFKHVSDFGFRASDLKLRDSKKLTPKARDKFYKILTTHPGICWAIGKVSAKVIDKINILEATKLAMKRAIKKLKEKPDFLILDGKMKLNLPIPQKSIVKADEKVFSCSVASIIAKVMRDKLMIGYHKKYPHYGFDLNKGYGTNFHKKRLKKYGRCAIHRRSFKYGGTKMEKDKGKKESEKSPYLS